MKNILLSLFLTKSIYALQSGTASTTRYWDCSGGACGCGFGDPKHPAHCHSNAMFKAPEGNSHGAKFYGSAAISNTLGGDDWLGKGCGKCFKLTGRANIGSHTEESIVILKGTNYCPPSNSVCSGQAHFDIAAPGFDFGPSSQSNTCDQVDKIQGLTSPQTCGFWMIRSQDPNENCDCEVFPDDTLKNGCNNFRALNWNNPSVQYEELEDCPAELKASPPCWEANGETWPMKAPDTCKAPQSGPSPPGPGPSPSGCPGGSLSDCMQLCPSTPPAAFQACVSVCVKKCQKTSQDDDLILQ